MDRRESDSRPEPANRHALERFEAGAAQQLQRAGAGEAKVVVGLVGRGHLQELDDHRAVSTQHPMGFLEHSDWLGQIVERGNAEYGVDRAIPEREHLGARQHFRARVLRER